MKALNKELQKEFGKDSMNAWYVMRCIHLCKQPFNMAACTGCDYDYKW